MTKVSVIIPVYNLEDYVGKCLLSIKNQTLKEFEAFVINDESRDNSLKIIKEVIGDDPRFTIIDKKNGGVTMARFSGIQEAKGEYICFVDGDDYLSDDALELLYNKGKATDADIVSLQFIREGKYDKSNYYLTEDPGIVNNIDYITLLIYEKCNHSIWCNFSKRELFTEGIDYDKELYYGEDAYLLYQLMPHVKRVAFVVGKPLYHYVMRKNSTTNDRFTQKKLENFLRYHNKTLNFFERENIISKEYRNMFILKNYTYLYYMRYFKNMDAIYKESIDIFNNNELPSDLSPMLPYKKFLFSRFRKMCPRLYLLKKQFSHNIRERILHPLYKRND